MSVTIYIYLISNAYFGQFLELAQICSSKIFAKILSMLNVQC